MKRRILITKSLSILALLILFSSWNVNNTYAQSSTITNGLSWLGTQQNADNSIGNITSTTDITQTTIAVIDTLQALSQTNTTLYSNAVSWLQSQSISTTDYLSERIFTLLSGGSDEGLLVSYRDPSSGVWGFYAGYGINNLDTALALDALKSVNYCGQSTISNAILYLVTNQNTDGGWGFYAGDDSNVYMTALVLQTFDMFDSTFNLKNSISNAAAYLAAHQNSDGGFGSSPSTVYETALSFLALLSSGQGSALPIQQAINYITTTQSSDGSWNEDAYSTALALWALGSYLPNLYIDQSEIGISYTSVTVGSIISVSAILHNNGGLGAANKYFSCFYRFNSLEKIHMEG